MGLQFYLLLSDWMKSSLCKFWLSKDIFSAFLLNVCPPDNQLLVSTVTGVGVREDASEHRSLIRPAAVQAGLCVQSDPC